MSIQVETVALGSPESEGAYCNFCERCPTVVAQQTLEWCYTIKDLSPDEPFLLIAKEGENVVGILPTYLYRHPLGNILTSVPHPGPLGGVAADLDHPNPQAIYGVLLGRMEEIALDSGCITMTVITSPFLDDRSLYDASGPWDFILENYCQVASLEELFGDDGTIVLRDYSRRSSNLSRNLARARQSVTVRETDEEAVIDGWWHIHRERHETLGAIPLPKELFTQLRHRMIQSGKGIFLGAFIEETLVAGAWYIHHGQVMDAYMPGASETGFAARANFLLTEVSLHRARELGVRWYNWQSSPSRASGVYRFKAQWGSRDKTYSFLTRRVGDLSAIQDATEAEVREAYQWHYVLPFPAIRDSRYAHVSKEDLVTAGLSRAQPSNFPELGTNKEEGR